MQEKGAEERVEDAEEEDPILKMTPGEEAM